jgi:lysylphosphatidylglycerol synthetase-like protein (DUF2156 family)
VTAQKKTKGWWARLMEEDQTPAQATERVKMFYDFFKHMTTLSSGSFIILTVMAEKFTINHRFTFSLAAAFICFMCSIFGSLQAMVQLPRHAGGSKMSTSQNINFVLGGAISILSFGAAFLLLELHLLSFSLGL